MATGNVTFTGNISGGADGARTFGPFTTNISTAVDETLIVTLAIGANTITVPSGATVGILLPPNMTGAGFPQPNPAYSGVLTLKGAAGDTGVVISSYAPTPLNWAGSVLGAPSPPSQIVINATAVGTMWVWFA